LDKLASKERPTIEEERCAEVLITLVESYEEEHSAIPDASPVEVFRTLITVTGLRQKDRVSMFGPEGIVSEVLSEKRSLNKTHIEKLSRPFQISPAAFFKLCSFNNGAPFESTRPRESSC
jgi:HTH-type transcriptional regulator/antitoxin HigA